MRMLNANNLSIGYSVNNPLIKDLHLEINGGDFVAIIGQNGVGKSTLIRTLSGLQPPLTGEVSLFSKRLSCYSFRKLAKKISIVLTGKPESLNLSVLELISLGRHPYSNWLGTLSNRDKEKIEHSMDLMAVNYIATKKLFQLSDGQLQKVMIARALAQDTDLIILDEPTSHLDMRNKIEVFNLLRKISDTGKGLLISTHEISLAAEVCHSFWCVDFDAPMRKGNPKKLIRQGVVDNIMHLEDHYLQRKQVT